MRITEQYYSYFICENLRIRLHGTGVGTKNAGVDSKSRNTPRKCRNTPQNCSNELAMDRKW